MKQMPKVAHWTNRDVTGIKVRDLHPFWKKSKRWTLNERSLSCEERTKVGSVRLIMVIISR